MRICLIAHRFYDNNTHMMQFANALVRRGDQVDVISLRSPGASARENVEGVNVYRIQHRSITERHPLQYLFRMLRYQLKTTFLLAWLHLRHPYDLIHVQAVPDFLVFSALVPKLMGTPVLLDLRDVMPELYASKFGRSMDSTAVRVLLQIERWSTRFASHVIIANPVWMEKISRRAVPPEKCTMIWYYPDPQYFQPQPRVPGEKKIMMYPGTISWHQGVDIAVRAFPRILQAIPGMEFHIYGVGDSWRDLAALVAELGLEKSVLMMPALPLPQIIQKMSECDVAIVPKRVSSRFGNEAASTKISEFMALGVPVVASRTEVESRFFNDSELRYFEPENEEALAEAVIEVCTNDEVRERLIRNGLAYVHEHGWSEGMQVYRQLVDRITGHPVEEGVVRQA
ncbi:MAG: glycosyltransferase family 4 protein [Acidobacteriota bacterium]|nr:glycosyltransferase family 4 protein [Acidobacteriota bacterium]